MSESQFVYLNYAQQEFRLCHGRSNYVVLPRRGGKTHGWLSIYMHSAQKSLPCGTGLFVGNTRKQIIGRTLPAILTAWKQIWGLREGENYCIGRPPKKLNYPEPFVAPLNQGGGWENTVSFANGFYWRMASLAVLGSVNGVTADVAAGDEGKFYDPERLNSEVIPCLSGVPDPYHSFEHSMQNPYYRGQCYVSDASLSAKGNWLEKKADTLDMVIDEGPYKGMTNRELKQRLLTYARRVIDINDKIYQAKKTGHRVLVKDNATIELARELREMCRQRTGKFRVLPNGDNSEANCKTLVRLGVLTEQDADLLYNADYLMSKEDYLWMNVVMKSEKFRKELNQMRCYLTGYWQGSTIDNVSLLGISYIKQMKLSLSPLVFAISILGVKIKRSTEGFYYALNMDVHGYIDGEDNGIIDQSTRIKKVSRVYNGATYTAETESPDFDHLAAVNDCRMDGDIHPDDQLFIAGDWNSRINWIVVGVVRLDPETMCETLFVVNSIFVKGDEKLDTLMKRFNSYYAPHRNQNSKITFFYDATAKHKGYALEGQEDFKDVVLRYLRAASWDVTGIDMGRPMAHTAKYEDINNGLAGLSYPAVRINKEKNEDLIVSLENADVRQGPMGWEKDKSGEKLPYNPDLDDEAGSSVSGASSASAGSRSKNVREEWRTDGSDAFDSLYIGVKHFRYGGGEVFACF